MYIFNSLFKLVANKYVLIAIIGFGLCNLMACGDSDVISGNDGGAQEDSKLAKIFSGAATIDVYDSWSEWENATYDLGQTLSCTKNSALGTFEASFRNGDESLVINIRNFRSAPKEYRCLQASNNHSKLDSVGDRFNGCGVEFSIDADDGIGFGTYATYRKSAIIPLFEFDGECSISISEAESEFRASINCSRLIQTHFDSALRNPIDSNAIASVTGELNCAIVSE